MEELERKVQSCSKYIHSTYRVASCVEYTQKYLRISKHRSEQVI